MISIELKEYFEKEHHKKITVYNQDKDLYEDKDITYYEWLEWVVCGMIETGSLVLSYKIPGRKVNG